MFEPKFVDQQIETLLFWISERLAIERKKVAGELDLTTDPIMATYSFTCVRRQDDRVTRFIFDWLASHADDPDLYLAVAAARLLNLPDTLTAIGLPLPWNAEKRRDFLAVLRERQRRKMTVFGSAYVIPAGAKGVPKVDHVADVLDDLAARQLRPVVGETLARYHARYADVRGVGAEFLAGQFVGDLKYFGALKNAADWHSFATSGPGSRKAMLRALIINQTADTIELSNKIQIVVRPCAAISPRGMTLIGAVGDEVCHWLGEDHADSDVDILGSLKPAFLTTRGPLCLVSSAYARSGAMFERWRAHYGAAGDPGIVCAYGTSRDFNSLLSEDEIAAEIARDPILNRCEYLSEWRDDLSGFISRDIVESCVGDYVELPPVAGIGVNYHLFVDSASGVDGGDDYAMAISHRSGEQIIVDAVRAISPPFSPAAVIQDELVPLARRYGVYSIWGDNFGAQLAEPIRAAGLGYEKATKSKSQIFVDPFLSLLNSRQITLPRLPKLINQICSLERSVSKAGIEQISHPVRAHDDAANAAAGAAMLAYDTLNYDYSGAWLGDGGVNSRAYSAQQLHSFITTLAATAGGGSGRLIDWASMPSNRERLWGIGGYQSPFRR